MSENRPAPIPRPPLPEVLYAGWPSVREFMAWADDEPERYQDWETVLQYLEAGDDEGITPQIRADAAQFVVFRKQMQAVRAVLAKGREIKQALKPPAGTVDESERVRRLQALLSEMSDLLLDLPDEDRRQFLPGFTAFREKLAQTAKDEKL